MSNVSRWSTTAANNQDVSPAGAQSGWTGSDVGPWARETMGGVARWYQDALWTALLFDGVGTKNTTKTVTTNGDADRKLVISNVGASDPAEHFPQGRLIQVIQSGTVHPGFVASSIHAGTTVTVTVDWITLPLASTSIDESDVLFASIGEGSGAGHYSKATLAAGGQLIGPTILSGGGTTAVRDAKFPIVANLPDGILWFNTSLSGLQSTSGGAWVFVAGGGGALTLNSAAGNPTLTLENNGVKKGQLLSPSPGDTVRIDSMTGSATAEAAAAGIQIDGVNETVKARNSLIDPWSLILTAGHMGTPTISTTNSGTNDLVGLGHMKIRSNDGTSAIAIKWGFDYTGAAASGGTARTIVYDTTDQFTDKPFVHFQNAGVDGMNEVSYSSMTVTGFSVGYNNPTAASFIQFAWIAFGPCAP